MDLDALRGFLASAPFIVDLGVQALASEPGRVTTLLPLSARHLQHTGQAHAGVTTTLADHSMGSAAQSLALAGQLVITAELKMSLLRPATGERLVCEAWVLKPGRSLMFTEAEVFAESAGSRRTLVAKASATMVLVASMADPAAGRPAAGA